MSGEHEHEKSPMLLSDKDIAEILGHAAGNGEGGDDEAEDAARHARRIKAMLAVLTPVLEAESDEPLSGEPLFTEALEALDDQSQASELVVALVWLAAVSELMATGALERLKALHIASCEPCRNAQRKRKRARGKIQRALNAAKAAALEAIAEDEEPWRASLDDDGEGA